MQDLQGCAQLSARLLRKQQQGALRKLRLAGSWCSWDTHPVGRVFPTPGLSLADFTILSSPVANNNEKIPGFSMKPESISSSLTLSQSDLCACVNNWETIGKRVIFSLKDEGCFLKCETFERHLVKDTTVGEALQILRDVSHHLWSNIGKLLRVKQEKQLVSCLETKRHLCKVC